jgi:hypothetical protein
MRVVVACVLSGCWLTACALPPKSLNRDRVEIDSFASAIACEVAAVAQDPVLGHKYGLINWHVKSALDLTVVNTVGGDGRVVQTIATTSGLGTVTPSLGASYKQTSIAHVDFATDVREAVSKFDSSCAAGPDPSGTHMGLAAWFASTLQALTPRTLGALSYTVEFDIAANAGVRFGYIIALTSIDAGLLGSTQGVHRMTVTIGPPDAAPPPPPPVEVVIVGDRRPVPKDANAPAGAPAAAPTAARPSVSIRRRSGGSGRLPALDDPNLNRLLIQQSPVRLQPGSLTR